MNSDDRCNGRSQDRRSPGKVVDLEARRRERMASTDDKDSRPDDEDDALFAALRKLGEEIVHEPVPPRLLEVLHAFDREGGSPSDEVQADETAPVDGDAGEGPDRENT